MIEAVRATERGTINTLEGLMAYEAGDWLITGVEGEVYPCKDSIFQKTYEPVIDYFPRWETNLNRTSWTLWYGVMTKSLYDKLFPKRPWYVRLWRWVRRMVGR